MDLGPEISSHFIFTPSPLLFCYSSFYSSFVVFLLFVFISHKQIKMNKRYQNHASYVFYHPLLFKLISDKTT